MQCGRGNGQRKWESMTRDHQHNPDPNTNAARIVAESAAGTAATPDGLEAAGVMAERDGHANEESG